MTIGLLFWVLMILSLLFGGLSASPKWTERCPTWASSLLVWVLLALLGWAVFGPALKG
jgi:hypothetical protein